MSCDAHIRSKEGRKTCSTSNRAQATTEAPQMHNTLRLAEKKGLIPTALPTYKLGRRTKGLVGRVHPVKKALVPV